MTLSDPLNEVNITCPHTHMALVKITKDGITVRCQLCTMQEHYLTWREVDTRRAAVTEPEPVPEVKPEKLESISPLLLPLRKRKHRKNDDQG